MITPLNSKLLSKKRRGSSIELGDVLSHNLDRLYKLVTKVAELECKKGVKFPFYIHVWFGPSYEDKEKIVPFCHSRTARPSPYQMVDHYLWKVEEGGNINFQWCIPKKEILSYILSNPNEFAPNYVTMLKRYVNDKIETLSDYMVDGIVM